MAAGSEGDKPGVNPEWSRTLLLDELRMVFDRNCSETAFHFTEQHGVVMLLEGMVTPYQDESGTFFEDLPVFVASHSTFEGKRRFALGFGALLSSQVFGYDWATSRDDLSSLTEHDAAMDDFNFDRLCRSNFNLLASTEFKKTLFSQHVAPIEWHRILEVELPTRPKNLEE